tara:strand:+ start:252 stop:578 length:327 start_codon:yes stop_codon:yes gene_type:complete
MSNSNLIGRKIQYDPLDPLDNIVNVGINSKTGKPIWIREITGEVLSEPKNNFVFIKIDQLKKDIENNILNKSFFTKKNIIIMIIICIIGLFMYNIYEKYKNYKKKEKK